MIIHIQFHLEVKKKLKGYIKCSPDYINLNLFFPTSRTPEKLYARNFLKLSLLCFYSVVLEVLTIH